MKIAEQKTEPLNVTLPNGTQKTGRIKQMVFEVSNDNDAKDLLDYFTKGVEINVVVGDYIFVKQFEEMKVKL